MQLETVVNYSLVCHPTPSGSYHRCQGLRQTVLCSLVGLGRLCCDDSPLPGYSLPSVVVQQVKVRGYNTKERLNQCCDVFKTSSEHFCVMHRNVGTSTQ